MQKVDVRTTVEIVGILSIVASLIFVGIQLKQDQLIALGNQYQTRAEISLDNYRATLESDVLLSATAKMNIGDSESLTSEERVAYNIRLTMDFITLDNNLHQYNLGLSDETYWESARERIKNRLRDDYTLAHYRRLVGNSPGPVSQFILQLVEEIEAEP